MEPLLSIVTQVETGIKSKRNNITVSKLLMKPIIVLFILPTVLIMLTKDFLIYAPIIKANIPAVALFLPSSAVQTLTSPITTSNASAMLLLAICTSIFLVILPMAFSLSGGWDRSGVLFPPFEDLTPWWIMRFTQPYLDHHGHRHPASSNLVVFMRLIEFFVLAPAVRLPGALAAEWSRAQLTTKLSLRFGKIQSFIVSSALITLWRFTLLQHPILVDLFWGVAWSCGDTFWVFAGLAHAMTSAWDPVSWLLLVHPPSLLVKLSVTAITILLVLLTRWHRKLLGSALSLAITVTLVYFSLTAIFQARKEACGEPPPSQLGPGTCLSRPFASIVHSDVSPDHWSTGEETSPQWLVMNECQFWPSYAPGEFVTFMAWMGAPAPYTGPVLLDPPFPVPHSRWGASASERALDSGYIRAFCEVPGLGWKENVFIVLRIRPDVPPPPRPNGDSPAANWKAEACDTLTQDSKMMTKMHCHEQSIPQPSVTSPPPPKRPDVLVILIDSVNLMHFFMKMPKTVEWLKAANASHDTPFEVIHFPLSTTVGANSWPNQTPLLTGLHHHRLPLESCGQSSHPVWLWSQFRRAGYRTAWIEGSAGSTMQRARGMWGWQEWKTRITDQDWVPRRLFQPNSSDTSSQHYDLKQQYKEGAPIGNPHASLCQKLSRKTSDGGVGVDQRMTGVASHAWFRVFDEGRVRCVAGTFSHDAMFESTRQFFKAYPGDPHFGFILTYEGHESSGTVLHLMDEALADHLSWLTNWTVPHQNAPDHPLKTPPLIVLMSDHGIHYSHLDEPKFFKGVPLHDMPSE